jgi:hypothetical protein
VLCTLAQSTSNRRLLLLLGCFAYLLRHEQNSSIKILTYKLGLLLQPFATGIAELDGVVAGGRLLFESFMLRHVFHHSENTQRFLHAAHDIDIDGQPFEVVVQQIQQLFLATLPQQGKWSLSLYLKELRKAKVKASPPPFRENPGSTKGSNILLNTSTLLHARLPCNQLTRRTTGNARPGLKLSPMQHHQQNR